MYIIVAISVFFIILSIWAFGVREGLRLLEDKDHKVPQRDLVRLFTIPGYILYLTIMHIVTEVKGYGN